MSFHCLLAYIISIENLGVNSTVVPLYVMNHFSPVAFKIFSWALVFNSLIVCLGVYLFGLILLGVYWISLISILNALHQVWETFVHSFFKYIYSFYLPLLSFWDSKICLLACLMLCCRSLKLCSFSFSLIFRLGNLYWPIFKPINSFFWHLKSAMDQIPWSEFFISIITHFNSKISIQTFLKFLFTS